MMAYTGMDVKKCFQGVLNFCKGERTRGKHTQHMGTVLVYTCAHTRTHRHRREGAGEQTHSATAKLKQCWGSFHIHKHRSAISPPQVSWKPTHGSMETTWQITESAANESACSSKMRSSGSSGAFRWESLSCVIKRQHDIKPVSFKEPSQIKALQLLSRLITERKQS